MKRKILLSRSGFTLIELLIYTAILSLVSVGFISFALHISSIQVKHGARDIVEENTRFALQHIGRIIQESEDVALASSTLGKQDSRVVLRTPDPATDPTVIEVGPDRILYVKQGEKPVAAVTGIDAAVTNFWVNAFNTSTGRVSLQVVLSVKTRSGADAFSRAATTVTTTFDIRD
ncbi:MAG: hypothetical protein A3J66_02625 [Candidatus Magasanikbacteria bacterium RIFCSPHIGHO2_02_FULL_47_14]|uniref:Prepilin-type N-terminal cleavage/methylation domain-containing protein n=1 Tax=Candidatus Magasanikbacteria bacterium RIFCSPHIGHO2_02_FULL_47_14 TaxID=1798680 RepID=A0A1F6MAP2_9BACT|nr:MAG: hypothetical protein A3J66_02625 [Candidatus Magasanikbacteria bacterium RIFCSPHIGHO2_02_FULL_47_14]